MTRLKTKIKKRFFFLELDGANLPENPIVFHKILEVSRLELLVSILLNGKSITYSNIFRDHLEQGKQYLVLESKFLFNYAKI